MNKVIQLNKLTTNPKTKYTQSNTAVCKFSIAVDRPTRQGEEKQADFFRVTAWGKTGEIRFTFAASVRKTRKKNRKAQIMALRQ